MPQEITIDQPLAARLERLGLEFQAGFLGAELVRHPENLEALSDLAHLLTLLGRHAEGLEADERLAKALPDNPLVHFNHACSLCLSGRLLEALDTLEHSIELGYDDPDHMAEDEDLLPLRAEPRFQRLLHKLQAQA